MTGYRTSLCYHAYEELHCCGHIAASHTCNTGSCTVGATDPTCTVLYAGAAAALDSHRCCGHATLLCAACMRTSLFCCCKKRLGQILIMKSVSQKCCVSTLRHCFLPDTQDRVQQMGLQRKTCKAGQLDLDGVLARCAAFHVTKQCTILTFSD